jgi:hypothetical protein
LAFRKQWICQQALKEVGWVSLSLSEHTSLQVFDHLFHIPTISEVARAIELQEVHTVDVHLFDLLRNALEHKPSRRWSRWKANRTRFTF